METIERALPPLPEIDDATRREFLIGAAGLFLLPAACGGGEEGDASDSGRTRTVEHFRGESEVPLNPRRVVALDDSALETAHILNVAVAGAPSRESLDYLGGLVPEGAESIGGNYEPNLERIAALEPDVIVGNEYSATEDNYERLAQIAPTVVSEFGEHGDRWKRVHSKTAEALGRQEEGKRVLEEHEARARELKEAIGEPGEIEVSLVRVATDANFGTYGVRSFCGSVCKEVGLSRPPQQRNDGRELSLERLDLAEGDVMFAFTFGGEEDNEFLADLQEEPLWQSLDVVQRGEGYAVGSHWLYAGPVSARRILDDLEKHLLGGDHG